MSSTSGKTSISCAHSLYQYNQQHLPLCARSYIVECTNANALLPLKRIHLLGMSAVTRARFRGTADPFGDR